LTWTNFFNTMMSLKHWKLGGVRRVHKKTIAIPNNDSYSREGKYKWVNGKMPRGGGRRAGRVGRMKADVEWNPDARENHVKCS